MILWIKYGLAALMLICAEFCSQTNIHNHTASYSIIHHHTHTCLCFKLILDTPQYTSFSMIKHDQTPPYTCFFQWCKMTIHHHLQPYTTIHMLIEDKIDHTPPYTNMNMLIWTRYWFQSTIHNHTTSYTTVYTLDYALNWFWKTIHHYTHAFQW